MRRLLVLAATAGSLGLGSALCGAPTHAAAAGNDTGSSTSASSAPSPSASQIIGTAERYLGYPYAYIGDDPTTGFSCIGFAHYVFAQSGVYVPEDLGKAYASAPHVDQSALQPGDLVFFQNTVWDGISHVDIYIGNGRMIGADSYQTGVQYDTLSDAYWQAHYLGATRPLGNPTGTPVESTPPASSGPSLAPPTGPTLSVKAGAIVSARSATTVYSGPGSGYATVDAITPSVPLTVVQAQGQWINVSYDDDNSYGWVAGSALNLPKGTSGGSKSNSATPRSTSTPSAAPHRATSTPSPSPSSVPSPTPLPTPSPTSSAGSQIVKGFHAAQPDAGRTLVVTADILFVRSGPDKRARILRRVRKGDRLMLLAQQRGWDYILQRKGERGWVSAQWVA